ncbi:MAG: hypothetical protein K5924_12750 [Chloroflexi bacterium]|nr:hypothetical protein [Chloroflexota bacterium]
METLRQIIELLLVPVLIPLAIWLRKQWVARDKAIAARAEEKVRAEVYKTEATATIEEKNEEISDLEMELEAEQQRGERKDATIEEQDQVIVSLTDSLAKLAESFKELSRGKAVSQ